MDSLREKFDYALVSGVFLKSAQAQTAALMEVVSVLNDYGGIVLSVDSDEYSAQEILVLSDQTGLVLGKVQIVEGSTAIYLLLKK